MTPDAFDTSELSIRQRLDLLLVVLRGEVHVSPGGQDQAFGLDQAQFGEQFSDPHQIAILQRALAGNTGTLVIPPEEDKPFKCPVIGCEKAYKNQNGLK